MLFLVFPAEYVPLGSEFPELYADLLGTESRTRPRPSII